MNDNMMIFPNWQIVTGIRSDCYRHIAQLQQNSPEQVWQWTTGFENMEFCVSSIMQQLHLQSCVNEAKYVHLGLLILREICNKIKSSKMSPSSLRLHWHYQIIVQKRSGPARFKIFSVKMQCLLYSSQECIVWAK